jgi:hypothetical protein
MWSRRNLEGDNSYGRFASSKPEQTEAVRLDAPPNGERRTPNGERPKAQSRKQLHSPVPGTHTLSI